MQISHALTPAQSPTVRTAPPARALQSSVGAFSPDARLSLDSAAGAAQLAGAGDLDRYYATAQGKTGAALLRALHLIVRTGHTDRGYAQARDELFGEIADLDGDDRVEDLFTGKSYGPITNRKNAYSQGMNTEHTWPQSQGATGIAQSDLHHLQPADIFTNERRGSLPYGEVRTVTWQTDSGPATAKLGVDALGTTVFEPRDDVKGDIARGLLYFYTRYSQSRTSRFSLEDFRHELPTLLKWHHQDPVTDTERRRNDAVQRVQGNRNPYVDHPEYVDAVEFAKIKLDR